MDYSDKEPLEVRDHTLGLLRKAMMPLLENKASGEDLTKLSEAVYAELEKMGQRLEKQIAENRAADVDMNPIAELMANVLELQKRGIENNITLDAPQLETLSKSVSAAVDYMKEQAEAQTELIKSFGDMSKREPIVLPEMRIANIDEIKIPSAQAVFNAKYPFTLNGRNIAMPLLQTASGIVLPVANADGSPIGGGGGSGGSTGGLTDTQLRASPVTVSGVGGQGRNWTLDQTTDSVKSFPQGVTTISGGVTVNNFPQYTTISGALATYVLNPSSSSGGDASAANQTLQIARLDQLIANQTNGTQKTQISNQINTTVSGTVITQASGVTTISGLVNQGADTWKVKDDFQQGEILPDQPGTNGVLTFTFSAPVDFIWITDTGTVTANVSRADPFGGVPSVSVGIPVFNQAPTPINVTPARSIIKLFAPTGSNIAMYGYRRV